MPTPTEMTTEHICDGDVVLCERCGDYCTVKTYRWESEVQVIRCADGIYVIGIANQSVPQRTFADWGRAEEPRLAA
ncbi:MAG TPA: hypothetical protein VFC99_21430 [Acidimicrobiia bacterium]|nr:hypothetical protein [Acidimicrobiia bacterium]